VLNFAKKIWQITAKLVDKMVVTKNIKNNLYIKNKILNKNS